MNLALQIAMRMPIRFNWRAFPTFSAWPNKSDPRLVLPELIDIDGFESAITQIRVDSFWKTTSKKRMPITDEIICGLAPQSVLDVGVSTGITSLDLIDRLASFSKFYCTDLFFSIPYERVGDVTYFYHPKTKHCIIRATDAAITYLRGYDALPLINGIAKWMLSRAPQYSADMRSAPLLHPTLASRLTSDRRLVAKEYNVFQEWDGEKVDVVKVANVLNREYFSHAEIRAALANLMKALKPEGKLIATDNKDVEKVSVFSKSGLESEVNGGSGVSRVILDMGSAS